MYIESQVAGLFDKKYYLTNYPDVREAGVDPLDHYLQTGWREGRNPSARFDTNFYIRTYLADAQSEICPLVHYVESGEAAGLATSAELPEEKNRENAIVEALLEDYFDADYYLASYPDVHEAGVDPLRHYMAHGWREGRNPSATFDTNFYVRTHLAGSQSEICPLVHYAESGRAAGLVTRAELSPKRHREIASVEALVGNYFDANYYLASYPDVRKEGVDPLEHYIKKGWRKGRNPSASFDNNFYILRHLTDKHKDLCPLIHYVEVGQFDGLATNEFVELRDYLSPHVDDVEGLIRSVSLDPKLVTNDILKNIIVPMFSARWYREKKDLPESVSDMECLFRYLVFDFEKGKGPGPFFDGHFYVKQAVCEGLEPPEDTEYSYHHWLKFGVGRHICPVEWFDCEAYLGFNPDLKNFPELLFLHFIRHGIHEGRRFNSVMQVTGVSSFQDRSRKVYDFICLVASQPAAIGEINANLEFWRSETMAEICDQAVALEPEIQRVGESGHSLLAPWHDDGYRHFELVRAQVSGTYDNIVLVPFCKMGGADFVAGVLTKCLVQIGKTIVLRTDLPDWARPDWFPDGITSINLSPWLQPLDISLRKRILYELVRMLRPKNVFNVNSRLAFQMFETYGARLRELTKLHTYYFCSDRTSDGREAGYPVTYFANIIPYTTALIDTEQLATTLTQRYCLPDELRSKISVMYTPAVSQVPDLTLAASQVAKRHERKNPVLLWAGRFDRQKRFDLLVEIAAAMPEVTFKCWGAAVLDPMPSFADLPKNLIAYPPFKSYDELPLEDCDGFVYTSGWDGLPTILIELGALGMPIVASSVGGVPELIDETNGWPVDEQAEVDDYVDAINNMLEDPDERVKRASALQQRVATRHNRQAYLNRLRGLIEQE